METFILEGNSYQNGQQHGELIAGKYKTVFDALFSSEYWQLIKKKFPANIPANVYNLRLIFAIKKKIKSVPQVEAYLNGILKAPGMSKMKLYTLLLNEVLAGDRRQVVSPFGCSTVVTRLDNGMVIGKNFDFQYPLAPYQGLIVRKQAGSLAFAGFSPLLMPLGGQLGINEAGLVISYNYSYANEGLYSNGIPASFVVHQLLSQCKTCREADKLLKEKSFRVNNGCLLGIADGKEMLIAELYGAYMDIQWKPETLTYTNHFQSQNLCRLNFQDSAVFKINHSSLKGKRSNESSLTRLSKLEKGVKNVKSINDLNHILGEHSDTNGLNNVFQVAQFWGTISSFIVLPQQLKIIYYDDIRTGTGITIDLQKYFN
jgi:predicted choloylglycine hydrolase